MKLDKQIIMGLATFFAMTAIASPENLLTNGDFAAGTNGWSTWSWNNGFANVSSNVYEDGVIVSWTNGGNGTLLLNCGNGWYDGGGGAYQIVPVMEGVEYQLWVHSGAADWWLPTGQMALIWLSDNTGTNAISTNAMFTVDPAVYGENYDIPHPMAFYSSMFEPAPAGATHVKVEFSSAMPPGTGGSVTFDNAALIAHIYDSDGDGLPDHWEINYGLDMNDATGVNGADGDPDADGLSNIDELVNNTSPQNPDTDADGLSDGDEVNTWLTNPNATDTDGDSLSDSEEVNVHGTDPNLADTDGDGLSDFQELYTYSTDPLDRDGDGDGLTDFEEILTYNTDPNVIDTDLDGFSDGYEVNTGYDPALASSTPDALMSIYTAVEVHFNAATGSVYRIEGTDSLSNSWSTIESGIPGNGGIIQRLYSTLDQSNQFFRAVHE